MSQLRSRLPLPLAALLTLAFAALPTPALARAVMPGTTYFVDAVTGSDTHAGTTASAPWRSLAKVNAAALGAGDTVAFRRGQSWTGSLRLTRSGTAAAPITVTGYGSGTAAPAIGGPVGECVLISGAYWTVRGVRATNCHWAGFEVRGSHNTLDGVLADRNVAGVSIAPGARFNTVRNSVITDNTKMSVNTPGGYDDSGAFGVLLNGDDNLISRNEISGSRAESFDFGYDGAAVEVFNGDRNRVEYTLARDNETFTELGRAPGESADGNVFAYNAVTSVHDAASFLVTRGAGVEIGPVTGTVAVNNSVRLPGTRTQGWVCYAGCAPTVLKLRNNAIDVGGKTGYEDGAGADEDNGVYSGTQTQFQLGAGSVQADPAFTTGLRLAPGSPAIGRGVPVGWPTDLAGEPVSSTAPDAGAYQYAP
ncbi:right-handed parallel beta-helix repeat-containing protein [Streptomyces sp. NPDC057638]|uniref:right-handed parallel beta-helix repeat-containing protein n=1 Tax=Streptomyces sp. NPDC057638 TaxID=3346190 RepID=UPI0036C63230